MLQQMRRNSRSLVIYTLFGVLITVFILSFGPQSGQDTAGCVAAKAYAVQVNGESVPEVSWRFAMVAGGAGQLSGDRARAARLRETALDKLIERELLAQGAEAAGFRISDPEIEDAIAHGEVYILGQKLPGERVYFDEDGFNYAKLEAFAKQFGLSGIPALKQEQRRERLAQAMRDLIAQSVKVSPREVLDEYTRENTSVSIAFVKFSTLNDSVSIVPSDAEVDAYMKDHTADVDARYERDKALYMGGGPWVKVRYITLPAEPVAAVTPKNPGDPAPVAMPDAGEAKARAALARVKGGEDFAKVAREVSKDASTAPRGGLANWRRVSSFGAWGHAADETINKLDKGQLSDVMQTDGGFAIVRVEDKLATDPPAADVKRDLAYQLTAENKAKTAAHDAAEVALAKAKAGTDLATQFPTDGPQKLKLAETGPLKKRGNVVGSDTVYVGSSKELAKAVFEGVEDGKLADQVYDVEDGAVVFKVVEKKKIEPAEFDKVKADRAAELAQRRSSHLVTEWLQASCMKEWKEGKLLVNETYADYGVLDPQTGKRQASTYRPCGQYGGPPAGMTPEMHLDPATGDPAEGEPGTPPMPNRSGPSGGAPAPSAPPAN